MRVELAIFNGSPLEWFNLIGIFKALFHNARRSPDEKLEIVRCHLKGKCRDVYANIRCVIDPPDRLDIAEPSSGFTLPAGDGSCCGSLT